ncbi:hypothetical protein [Thermus sp.]|uniref:hypothetical protein n=1 Tax=Thermus sp. TaxID=275 RepID=UPI00307F3885
MRGRRLALSLQVLQEFYVVATRKLPEPMPPRVARQVLLDLGGARLHLPSLEDVLQVAELSERHRLSFWDAMVLHSAGLGGAGGLERGPEPPGLRGRTGGELLRVIA